MTWRFSWLYVRTSADDLRYASRIAKRQAGENNPKHSRGGVGSFDPEPAYTIGNRSELAVGQAFGIRADIEGGRGHNDIVTPSGGTIEVKGTLKPKNTLQFNLQSELKEQIALLVYLRNFEWAMLIGWCTRTKWYAKRRQEPLEHGGLVWRVDRSVLRPMGELMERELARKGGSVGDIRPCLLCGSYLVGDADVCPQKHRKGTFSSPQQQLFEV